MVLNSNAVAWRLCISCSEPVRQPLPGSKNLRFARRHIQGPRIIMF